MNSNLVLFLSTGIFLIALSFTIRILYFRHNREKLMAAYKNGTAIDDGIGKLASNRGLLISLLADTVLAIKVVYDIKKVMDLNPDSPVEQAVFVVGLSILIFTAIFLVVFNQLRGKRHG